MKQAMAVLLLAALAWNADAFARPIPPHMAGALVLGATGLAVGLVVGFKVGRNVGHRDTAAGLPALYVNRKVLGRAK